MQKTEELKNFSGFRRNFIDTILNVNSQFGPDLDRDLPSDTDNEQHLGLSGNVEVTGCTRRALQADLFPLLGQVLLHIRFSTLEDDLAFCFRDL